MAHRRGHPGTRRALTTRLVRSTSIALLAIAAGVSPPPPMAGRVSAYANDESLGQLLESQQATPVALGAADLDEDGMADLVSGYATSAGGIITLQRGNVDFLFPNAPGARQRRLSGRLTNAPFLPMAVSFAVPSAPDFLHTGDFDADGHSDVLTASQGGHAFLLRGDGKGALGPAQPLSLQGRVTTMAVGDVNGPDGLADVVIGVTTTAGAHALVFAGRKGALMSSPEVLDLPSEATAAAIGDVDEDLASDVAVAAGQELLIVHGEPKRPALNRALTAAPRIERRALPFAVEAIAAGDFTGDRRIELALVSDGGEVQMMAGAIERAESALARGADDLLVVRQSAGQRHILRAGRQPRMHDIASAAVVLPMRLDADARDDLVMLDAGESATVALTLPASTFVVVNTNDSGEGSLRQAILNANANPGDDLITFDIPGPGPHTIVPLTLLPSILPEGAPTPEDTLVIDGTSEPDFAGAPVIELSGAAVGGGAGLLIHSNCVVRGLVINRFGSGIAFESSSGPGVQGSIVEGNYLGTDITGSVALGNGVGVSVGFDAFGVTIGGTVSAARNVVSGNRFGVIAGSFASTVTIQGNFIGTDASGTADVGNVLHGVLIGSGGAHVIGGPSPGARNIISGNDVAGAILFDSGPNLVSGNFVGTDVTGTRPLGNGGTGIDAEGSATITDNLVSANGGHGLAGSTLSALEVRQNRIGTNRDGTAALGNSRTGIFYSGIGQLTVDNLVSGNGEHGIFMGGMSHVVQGNRIGTDITGTLPLGNRGNGVHMQDIANEIGGPDAGAGNIIAFNNGDGVTVETFFASDFRNNALLSNAIFSNGGLGIDLGDDGVTPNDACDADTGGNDFQNFPGIAAVASTSSTTTIQGQLNSKPNTSYLLQFFSSAAADPSGFGEGARFLGSTTVTTDAACNASFTATLPAPVAPGHFVTATATDPLGSTSEFSNALPFVPLTPQQQTRQLIDQVRALVDQGELGRLAGFVLTLKLQAAIFFLDRDRPRLAAQQLHGFIRLVESLVRGGHLEPLQGQALVDAARAILVRLGTT